MTASIRSENFAKSDQVLPVSGSAPVGNVAPGASLLTSVWIDVSAPSMSVCDEGLSTCRSMST